LAGTWGIQAMPTFLVFNKDKLVEKFVGGSKDVVEKVFAKALEQKNH
jgi:hypothetical protein